MELAALTPLLITYRYWLLFPIACIEGPFLAFVAGMLIATGYLGVMPTFIILLLGDILPDTFFLLLGRFGKRSPLLMRLMDRVGVTEERLARAAVLWHEHPGKTMLLTKFAYGFSAAFLTIAGLVHMPVAKFYSYTIPIGATTIAILMTLGYYFGTSLTLIENTYSMLGIAATVVLIAFTAYHLFGKAMMDRLANLK